LHNDIAEVTELLYVGERSCRQHIKNGAFGNLYCVCGAEEYLKRECALALAHAAVAPRHRDFDLHRFEGKETTLGEILQACDAFPLGGEKSCVLVRDFPLFPQKSGAGEESGAGKSKTPKTQEILDRLNALPAHCVLIFWQAATDIPLRAEKKGKENKQAERLTEMAAVFLLNRPGDGEIIKNLQEKARRQGVQLDAAIARQFLETVGGSLGHLYNEAEKLFTYKGEGAVAAQDIDAVCIKSVEADVFEMVSAITAHNADLALQKLDDRLRGAKNPAEEAQLILGALVSKYADMLRVMACVWAGRPAEDAAAFLRNKGSSYRFTAAYALAKRYKLPQLRLFLDVLDDADRRLKSTAAAPRLILETTFVSLLQVR
jgi:DNA polymerase-3 subunit delta